MRRETPCSLCFRGEAFTCQRVRQDPNPGPWVPCPTQAHGMWQGHGSPLQLPSQSGKGPPTHTLPDLPAVDVPGTDASEDFSSSTPTV